MKLRIDPRFTVPDSPQGAQAFHRELVEYLRDVSRQVNDLAAGHLEPSYNAHTSAPTGIVLRQGDIVRHADPVETGTASSKYVVTGWMQLTDGTASAGSVAELRSLTGN